MKTYFLTPKEIQKKWILIDAEGLVLGRLASEIAKIVRGKHKAAFTPHMDCGDRVVVINAEKVVLTGKKADHNKGKVYYWHTGYAGGIKETTAGKILRGKFPARVIEYAVKRMLTHNALRAKQMRNLFVYAGSEHPHTAQNPEKYDFGAKNRKNLNRGL